HVPAIHSTHKDVEGDRDRLQLTSLGYRVYATQDDLRPEASSVELTGEQLSRLEVILYDQNQRPSIKGGSNRQHGGGSCRCGIRWSQGQLDREDASSSQLARDLDLAPVKLGQALGEREAQARALLPAAGARFQLLEFLEQATEV